MLREVGDDFQADSSRQGTAFEQQAKAYLGALGFKLHGRHKFTDIGCEVDDVAEAPNGELVYFEYKGSFKGARPGMRRTDTAKKALLTGFLLRAIGDDTPYYVLTSHLPERGAAQRMVNTAVGAKAVSGVLELNDPAASQTPYCTVRPAREASDRTGANMAADSAGSSPRLTLRPTEASIPSASASSGELDIDRFRGWALGNLVDNRNRGLFAEWLVGEALGVIEEATPRREWDAYDLLYRETKIEIKASGRSQSWSQEQPSKIRFGIEQRSSSWTAASNEWTPHDQPTRFADVYVFCLHEPVPATNQNVADPAHWTFWVVSTNVLDQELGSQKSVGVRALNRLASPIAWSDIRNEVDARVDSLQSGAG